MITLLHGVNYDGVGYWYAVIVEVSGEVRSRIISVRAGHPNRAEQLMNSLIETLTSCGVDVEKVENKISTLASEVRSAHPAIFGRFG